MSKQDNLAASSGFLRLHFLDIFVQITQGFHLVVFK
eukprot:UN05946